MSRKSNRSLKLFWRALDKSQSLSSDRLGLHRLISSMLEDGETVDSFISDIRNQNRTIKGTLAILKESSKLEKELERLENASVRPTGKVLPALPSDEAWARYMKGRTPFNAENVRGTTEHVGHPIVRISKANYPGIYDKYAGKIKQGLDYDDMIRREDIWPIVTSETAEQFRRVDRYNAFKEKLANRKRMMGDYPTSVSNVGTASKEERDRFLYERDLLTIRMGKAIVGRRASGIGEVKGTFYNEPISWRQQLGLEDTGVSSDFDYLRKQEKEQKDRRKRAERFLNRKHDEASLRRFRAKESFKFAMYDSDEQFIQGAMRDKGWSREQAEQVYFKNLTENTKWLRLIGKNNPAIAKNLIPIAKAVGKASGLPIIGALARNPALGAITALIGGGLSAGSYSLSRSGTLAKWMNARAVTGDIGPGTFSGLAATGMSYDQMLQSLAKYSVKSSEARFGGGFDKYAELAKYGVDVSGLFNPYLTAEERRSEEYRVISSANQADRAAIMSTLGMSPEEYRSERLKNTARSKWSLSDLQLDIYQGVTKKMKENHPILDFFVPDKFYQFHSLLAANKELEDRKFFGDKAVDARNEIYNLHRWDEIRETAEIDDRYRAGMYDNSITNNDASRSISLQVNVASPQITTTGDPLDFAKGISIIGSRALSEYQSVIENTDTKRKQ